MTRHSPPGCDAAADETDAAVAALKALPVLSAPEALVARIAAQVPLLPQDRRPPASRHGGRAWWIGGGSLAAGLAAISLLIFQPGAGPAAPSSELAVTDPASPPSGRNAEAEPEPLAAPSRDAAAAPAHAINGRARASVGLSPAEQAPPVPAGEAPAQAAAQPSAPPGAGSADKPAPELAANPAGTQFGPPDPGDEEGGTSPGLGLDPAGPEGARPELGFRANSGP